MINPSPATLRLADDYFIMADNLDELADRQGKLNELLRFLYPTMQRDLQVMVGELRHQANTYRREARLLAFGREDAPKSQAFPLSRFRDAQVFEPVH